MLQYADRQWLLTNGVPDAVRTQVWLRCSGAVARRANCALPYDRIAGCAEGGCERDTAKQIQRDLGRTYPHNIFFDSPDAEGARRLRRVLHAFAWTHPGIG